MFQSMLPLNDPRPSPALEAKGVVYTKSWVVDLLLELAGYSAQSNLVDAIAVEPAAGEGAFYSGPRKLDHPASYT
jgi:adenine-specific DNA-methyltransferase